MKPLSGQTIFVTGGARRIGRALCLALANIGADIVLHHSSSPDEARAASSEIVALGQRCHVIQADFSDLVAVQALFDQLEGFQPVTGLINNAAIFEDLTWQDTDLTAWQRHIDINLSAPFLLSQAFARQLPPTQPGRIVNILDWRALRPGPDHLPYTISKTALAGLTRSLAIAFAPQITVNGLALGAILPPADKPEADSSPPDNPSQALPLPSVPAGRWAYLDEVTRAVEFLLAGPAYITGEIIHLDGGRHLI